MVIVKEYRICMPLTVEEYRIGQRYMIARHSHEQSDSNGGIEVVECSKCTHREYGQGRYTEKRIHLVNKLPQWLRSVVPRIFYITEKAWNYYPVTITEYTCSFIPQFHISIRTRYEDNNGSSDNCLHLSPIDKAFTEVDYVDIAYDEIPAKNYKEEEDPKYFQSERTRRGPLIEGWRETMQPIMCSYKLVRVNFDYIMTWGMRKRLEVFIQKCIREILLVGHRQAFAWIDDWYDMTLSDVQLYEEKMQEETNEKLQLKESTTEEPTTSDEHN